MGRQEDGLHLPGPGSALLHEAAPCPEPQRATLLDLVAQATADTAASRPPGILFGEPSFESALYYYQERVGEPPRTKDDLIGLLSRDIAGLDALLTGQINAVLHHPRLQQLEAAWRGLAYLVDTAEGGENVRILVLHSLQFVKWNALREKEDARFIGLTLPRILMRLPYEQDGPREDGFIFAEDVTTADRSGHLWGNAAWAFGALLIASFVRSGWFADIRGTNQGPGAGGVVEGLPVPWFHTDRPGVALKSPVETMIGQYREKELSDLGHFLAELYLSPHFQLDELTASVRLV